MKMIKQILNTEKGFNLIELTVAAAVSVIISMGIVKTNETGQMGVTKVTTDMDLKLWQQQILMQKLGNSEACLRTFEDVAPGSSATLTELKNSSDITFATVGDVLENTSGSWVLRGISRAAFVADDGGAGLKGTCKVSITVERNNKKSFGAKTKQINFPLICTRRNDLSWASCSAKSGNDSFFAEYIDGGTGENYLHSQGEYVRIGAGGGGEITAPFEVTVASGTEFPGTGSGVYPAVKILNPNHALVFRNTGVIYSDNNSCLNIFNGEGGGLDSGLSICDPGASAQPSIILGSYNNNAGENSFAIGTNLNVLSGHNFSTMLGEGDLGFTGATATSTASSQFSGFYSGGYRFMLGDSNTGSNVYITKTGATSQTTFDGDINVKGNIYTDIYYANSSDGTGRISCSDVGGSFSLRECSCAVTGYSLISGGGAASGYATVRVSHPSGLNRWTTECQAPSAGTLIPCTFHGVCSKINAR